jgi:hypothetical protein
MCASDAGIKSGRLSFGVACSFCGMDRGGGSGDDGDPEFSFSLVNNKFETKKIIYIWTWGLLFINIFFLFL